MKLIRVGESGQEKPGVMLDDQRWLDVSQHTRDFDEDFFSNGGLLGLREFVEKRRANAASMPVSIRLGPPVARPGKIVCVGLNYRDHAAESKMEIPEEPVLFCKAPSSLSGPNDDVTMPRDCRKLDWEVELAVVIGARASYVPRESAGECIAGYAILNDYSERSFQLERGGQWVKGKSCDTFAPLGPFLGTPDEISNPGQLGMWLKVNGEYRQKSTTANMIFDIPFLISYISQFMTLLPGDIVSTGTPPGVGLGMNPPRYLKHEDVVELGIDGLGIMRQRIKEWRP